MHALLTYLPFGLCLISGSIHCIRLYQRKIEATNSISWTLWAVIAVALFLTYRDMKVANIWIAIGNMIFPIINAIICISRWKEYGMHLEKEDWYCAIFGVISLVMWGIFKSDPTLVVYANYVAIIADLCALIPMIRLVSEEPEVEIPFPWLLFSFAFLLSMLTLEKPTEFIMPAYMVIASGIVGIILAKDRLWYNKLHHNPWYKDWI